MLDIIAEALHALADAVPGSVGEIVHAKADQLLQLAGQDVAALVDQLATGHAPTTAAPAAPEQPAAGTPGDTTGADDAYARGWQAGYQDGWTDRDKAYELSGISPGPGAAEYGWKGDQPPAEVHAPAQPDAVPSPHRGPDIPADAPTLESPTAAGQQSALPTAPDAPLSGGPETEPATTDSPTPAGAAGDKAP